MPYDVENLAELNRRLSAELPLAGSGQVLRRNLYTPFARALAGAVHGLHGHIEWRVKQMFPQTCDDDVLETLHAPLWLGEGRLPAVAASGKGTVKGIAGTAVPQGTLLNRSDGAVFVVKTGVTIPESGKTGVDILAAEAGAAGNTAAGEKLTIANTISGVESTVETEGLDGGSDIESIESLRERIIESRKNGKDVGRTTDWARWAREVPGVTRAWAVPQLGGIGTVTVYFMRDGDADPYPNDEAQAAVQLHLEQTGLPFGEIIATAPKKRVLDMEIQIKPDSPEKRQSVEAKIRALIARHAAPVQYDSDGYVPQPATGITIPLTHFAEAVSTAPGEYDHVLQSPIADVSCNVGELLELGRITWL